MNTTDSKQFALGAMFLATVMVAADPAVMQLMKDNGLTSVPAFLLYNPTLRREPIILKDLVSEQQLLDAIRYNFERSQKSGKDDRFLAPSPITLPREMQL